MNGVTEEALAILEITLKQERLNDVQELVFRQSCQGQTYLEIAESFDYDADYIKNVGSELWKLFSEVLGEKVTKSNLKSVLRRISQQPQAPARSETSSSNTSAQLSVIGGQRSIRSEFGELTRAAEGSRRSQSQTDWGEAVDVSVFFGRTAELIELKQWIVNHHCRLVALLGMGGVGKTTLSVKLAEQIQDEFEYVIWRSLLHAPSLDDLLASLIKFLSNEQEINLPETVDAKVSRLITYLREHRCLLILDNAEAILCSGECAGHYPTGYDGYSHLLRRVGEVPHQSCLILTSREKPQEVASQEGKTLPVRSLQLSGLKGEAGQELLQAKGLSRSEDKSIALIERYGGNPLALKIVATNIQELFDGNICEFLAQGTAVFGGIRELLAQQFDRLSELEKQMMYWLAINREPTSPWELREDIVPPVSKTKLLEALESLRRRSLIEKSSKGFTQQPVVMEYMTEQLIEQVCQEIATKEVRLLISYALIKAQAKDYVRESQVRIILELIVDRLCAVFRSKKDIEYQLNQILLKLRAEFSTSSGYAGGNIVNLLCQLKIDLTGYNFSHLAVWQAYLVGVNLYHVNFAHADLFKSVFTAVLNATLSVAFSPDGRLLAMGNADNKVRIWQVAEYKELLTCEGHASWVCSVAFSPNSQTLASGSFDKNIKLWDIATGECLKTLQGHMGWVWSVAFSPDGQTLASSGDDHTIRMWDVFTGQCLRTLREHTGTVWSTVFSPDGQTLASSGSDNTLRLWDLKIGQSIKILPGHTSWVRSSIAFSPDGQTLASGGDNTVRVWDISTGQCLNTLKGHTNCVLSVAYAPNTGHLLQAGATNSSKVQILASGSQDCTVRLWNVSTGQCLNTLKGHPNAIWSVAFHPDDQTLASGSTDSTVKLWNTKSGQSLKTFQGYSTGLKTIAFSPDGQILASGGDDKTIRLWDIQSGRCRKTLPGHSGWIWCVVFSRDSQTLASSSNDGTIRLWNVSTGQLLRTLQGHTNIVFSVALSPDGRTLASGSNDQTIRVWDVQTGECLKTLPHQGRIWSVAFSPNGQILASGSGEGMVSLWNVQSGECLKALQGHTSLAFTVAFSPDGQILASGSDDKAVKLWDVQSGECLKTLQGHTGSAWSIAFSPDGQTLASSGNDRTIKLWHVQSGKYLKTLQGHVDEVWSTAFSPHSSILASGSQDGTIKLWDVLTERCIKTLRDKRPYEQMSITKVRGLTEAQKVSLKALGAVEIE